MGIKIKLGCSICNFNEEASIELPFDCDNFLCPKCGEVNSLSIISFNENIKIRDMTAERNDNLVNLMKIREL